MGEQLCSSNAHKGMFCSHILQKDSRKSTEMRKYPSNTVIIQFVIIYCLNSLFTLPASVQKGVRFGSLFSLWKF